MWKYDCYQILENTVDKTKKHNNSPNTIGTHITGLAMNSTFHSASGKEEKAKSGKETLSRETGRRKVGPWVPSRILAQSLDLMPKSKCLNCCCCCPRAQANPVLRNHPHPCLNRSRQLPPGGTKLQPGEGQFELGSRNPGTLVCYTGWVL